MNLTATDLREIVRLWVFVREAQNASADPIALLQALRAASEPALLLRLAEFSDDPELLGVLAEQGSKGDLAKRLVSNLSLRSSDRRKLLDGADELSACWAGTWPYQDGLECDPESTKRFLELVDDPNENVRFALACNGSIPADVRHRLTNDPSERVLAAAAELPLTLEESIRLAGHPSVKVRKALAEMNDHQAVLQQLAHDPEPDIRTRAEKNLRSRGWEEAEDEEQVRM